MTSAHLLSPVGTQRWLYVKEHTPGGYPSIPVAMEDISGLVCVCVCPSPLGLGPLRQGRKSSPCPQHWP